MPAVAIRPVTSSGVSAANCVAAMLMPACHPERDFPARKYSWRFSDALPRARSPFWTAYTMNASTMSRSIIRPAPDRGSFRFSCG